MSASPPVVPALFHIGYNLPDDVDVLRSKFRGVKYVLLAGSNSRARLLADAYLRHSRGSESRGSLPDGDEASGLANICTTGRYVILQPDADVLTASHGIGRGSADILFQEMTSMLRAAGATGFKFIRTGTCGGCGVKAGTVVVSERVCNGEGREVLSALMLGKRREYPAHVDEALANELRGVAVGLFGKESVTGGVTMACDSFYEEQGRLDGAVCDYSAEEQDAFLRHCRDVFCVKNFEMESLALTSFCARAGVPCAVVCAVLVNRLGGGGDTPTEKPEVLREWEERPVKIAAQFVWNELRGVAGKEARQVDFTVGLASLGV